MIICIKNVLPAQELAKVRKVLAASTFVDGKGSAGWHAALVKNNQQASRDEKSIGEAEACISRALTGNEVFRLAARPKQLSSLLFSKYSDGMSYGTHVDDALMGGIRSDLSFTVFLSDPSDYMGGELVMDLHQGDHAFKLDAGDMVLYPSTTLHRVEPVTQGTRLAAVGWAQSLIRRSDQRELLFDIETARLSLFKREGKSLEFDLLSKSLSNLLRMWAE
jgi:PKHD-type hydroxylase